jgi:hypothetical protein
VMVENMGGKAATTAVRLNGYPRGSVSVLHMSQGENSLLATSGVTIQGQSVAASGKLPAGQADTVNCPSGVCSLSLAPYSAALVTLSTW